MNNIQKDLMKKVNYIIDSLLEVYTDAQCYQDDLDLTNKDDESTYYWLNSVMSAVDDTMQILSDYDADGKENYV